MDPTRRQVVGGTVGLAAGLAGCGGRFDGAADQGRDDVFTTFFTLADFARQVAGEQLHVENPIPAGAMGHRYEVGTSAQLAAADALAYVYLDVDGFQRWARQTARNIEDDSPEVVLVDALDGIDLLPFDAADHDHGDADADDHEDHGDDHTDDHGDEDDRHGDFDPHYWVDPVRAQRSVATIADGLASADGDNAATYRENADEYTAALEALHEDFESALAARSNETVVIAGHNSYQYLATRYGFDVHSPVGVSPQAEPSQSEIADTIDLIDDHGIDVVLYDTFEADGDRPPQLARTILAESTASDVQAISPVEATTETWNDRGWGYLDQMREINLPAVTAALGAG